MSIEAMTICLNHSRAKGTAKVVLLGIANHINPDNDGAWPSQERLAAYANVSVRSVREATQQLIDLGEITVQVAGGQSKTQYKTNLYFLNLQCPNNCDRTSAHREAENRAEVSATDTDRAEVFDNQGGTLAQSGRNFSAIRAEADFRLTVIEPLREPLVKTNGDSTNQPSLIESQFKEFYKIYPRKEKPLEAKRAFISALKVVDYETLLKAVLRFASDPNLPTAKQFIPHPSTWLNAGEWESEPLPERVQTIQQQKLWRDKKLDAQAEASRESARLAIAEAAEAKAYAKANPAPRCQHNRIAVICDTCNRKSTTLKTQQLEG